MKTRFSSRGHKPTKQAFTLVELLVIIAIVGILAGILIPTFARARQKAKNTACKSNLKQWGYALNMYVEDFDRFPDEWVFNGPRKINLLSIGGIVEAVSLRSYLFNRSVNALGAIIMTNGIYQCPGAPPPLFNNFPKGYVLPAGYSPNWFGTDRLGSLALGVGGDTP